MANASMGALARLWDNHHVDMYSKYMIFRAISCNLLLWRCENWALQATLLDKLEVFLHRGIRRILGVKMGQVRERHIKNSHIRTMFYNILCVRNQVAFRKFTYVWKILRQEGSHIPTRLLTAWCDNQRKRGGWLFTNKDILVKNLRLVLPDVDDAVSFSSWGFHGVDAKYWFLLL